MRFNLEGIIASVSLGIICIISLLNAIVRYTTNYSFAFTEELSVALLVVTALFGAANASRHKQHIRIDILEKRLPLLMRKILYLFQFLVIITVLLLIIYYGSVYTYEEYSWGTRSPALDMPNWIYLIWLPIAAFLILWRTIVVYYKKIIGKSND